MKETKQGKKKMTMRKEETKQNRNKITKIYLLKSYYL
jgi:hypothetical protein